MEDLLFAGAAASVLSHSVAELLRPSNQEDSGRARWRRRARLLRDLCAGATLLGAGGFILAGALVQYDRGGAPDAQVWAMSLGLLAGGAAWLLAGWRRAGRRPL